MSTILTSLFLLTADAIDSNAIAKEHTFSADALVIVMVLGFLAATMIGSIAWYNSKRPPGWEDKERPPIVPDVELSENPGLGTPEQ
jgi:Ca2+/Na+ antiporter